MFPNILHLEAEQEVYHMSFGEEQQVYLFLD